MVPASDGVDCSAAGTGWSWSCLGVGVPTDLSANLGVSTQAIYNWRRQERIDQGLVLGLTSTEHAELIAARRRIAQLEETRQRPCSSCRRSTLQ
jgi:hypothetical protein